MSILDIAKQRFSVRNYLDKEISQETLETIFEAAHVAPTAANMRVDRAVHERQTQD